MAISARMRAANTRQGISSPSSSQSSGNVGFAATATSLNTNPKDRPGYMAGSSTTDSASSQAAFRATGGVPQSTSSIGATSITNPMATPTVPIFNQNPNGFNYGSFVPGTIEQQKIDVTKDADNNALQSIADLMNTSKESSASLFDKAQRQSGEMQARQRVNDLSAQVNSITSNATAQKLSLIGQGRGVPEVLIGGQQAQIDREAAIQALPLTAQLQAAQDNLTAASQTMNNLFKIYTDDANTEYNHKLKVIEFTRIYADKQTDRKLADIDKQLQDRRDDRLSTIKTQNDFAQMAFRNNQGALGARLMSLNPQSATYKQDFSKLVSGISDPMMKLDIDRKTLENAALRAANSVGNAGDSLNGTNVGDTVDSLIGVFSSNKIAASTKTLLGTITGVQGALEQVAKDNSGGKFKGISPLNAILDLKVPFTDAKVLNLPFGARDALTSKEGIQSRGYINGINLKIQQWASGAALTKQQTEQVEEMTPRTKDTDRVVREKMNTLYEFMNQQIKSSLLSEGVQINLPDKVDLWKQKDSLDSIFKE